MMGAEQGGGPSEAEWGGGGKTLVNNGATRFRGAGRGAGAVTPLSVVARWLHGPLHRALMGR